MKKFDVSSAREELVEEDIWEEDIWAEIIPDKNGETVLRNVSSNNRTKLEAIDVEEDERRRKHQQTVFVLPKKDSPTSVSIVNKDKTPVVQYKSGFSPETSSSCEARECSYSEEESLTDDDDVKCFGDTKYQEFHMTDLSGIKLKRKDENPNFFNPSFFDPNYFRPSSMELNTKSSEKETIDESGSNTLRQNWFSSSFTNKFTKKSTEPAKLEKQESCLLEPNTQITQPQTLAKRIRNVIRPKALLVCPGFLTSEKPVLELDSIARPKQTQEAWKQVDLRCVCEKFGAKAEKYVVRDDTTTVGEKNPEKELMNNDDEEAGKSRWSKLKFWETGLSQKTALPEASQESGKSNSERVTNKTNKNVKDYYQMLEQRSSE